MNLLNILVSSCFSDNATEVVKYTVYDLHGRNKISELTIEPLDNTSLKLIWKWK